METTLKTRCTGKHTPGNGGGGTTTLTFGADYQDGRNQEWATATPAVSISFTVREELGERWEQGKAYTFTVSESDES